MKLLGGLLSPFVRRTAVSLNALGMPFELEALSVFGKPEAVAPHNPLTRIPVLVLDDGESLIDSAAILDALDEMAGPGRRLTPASGAPRRHVLKLTAVGVGAAEKIVTVVYEHRFHPPEKVHQPWVEQNEKQAVAGFAFLDGLAEKAGDRGWLAGTERISQADITAAVAFAYAQRMRPNLALADLAPHLARFAARCEALDAFRRAPVPD